MPGETSPYKRFQNELLSAVDWSSSASTGQTYNNHAKRDVRKLFIICPPRTFVRGKELHEHHMDSVADSFEDNRKST